MGNTFLDASLISRYMHFSIKSSFLSFVSKKEKKSNQWKEDEVYKESEWQENNILLLCVIESCKRTSFFS